MIAWVSLVRYDVLLGWLIRFYLDRNDLKMTVFQLQATQLQQIQNHAERTYPEECCGLLLGQVKRDSPEVKVLIEVWETANAWDSQLAETTETFTPEESGRSLTKSRRYWIDPKDLLNAQRSARDRGLDIIGIYHSHPDHPAVPSECDRTLAWAGYSYMIVSVQQGTAQDTRSWQLNESHQFHAETLQLILPQSQLPT